MTQFLSVIAEGHNNPSVVVRTPERPQEQRPLNASDLVLSRGGGGGAKGQRQCQQDSQNHTHLDTTGLQHVSHFNFFVLGFTSPSHCCLEICLYHKDGLGLTIFFILRTQMIRTTAAFLRDNPKRCCRTMGLIRSLLKREILLPFHDLSTIT